MVVDDQMDHPVQGISSAGEPGLGWLRFGEFPRLVGRYCSYLLPKQDGGTSQIQVNKTQSTRTWDARALYISWSHLTNVKSSLGIRVTVTKILIMQR